MKDHSSQVTGFKRGEGFVGGLPFNEINLGVRKKTKWQGNPELKGGDDHKVYKILTYETYVTTHTD